MKDRIIEAIEAIRVEERNNLRYKLSHMVEAALALHTASDIEKILFLKILFGVGLAEGKFILEQIREGKTFHTAISEAERKFQNIP